MRTLFPLYQCQVHLPSYKRSHPSSQPNVGKSTSTSSAVVSLQTTSRSFVLCKKSNENVSGLYDRYRSNMKSIRPLNSLALRKGSYLPPPMMAVDVEVVVEAAIDV